MIEHTVAQWHALLRGELPGGLDELLHDDVVFYSPIVFTPQRGKEITTLYLRAAMQTLPGDGAVPGEAVESATDDADARSGTFRYVNEVLSGNVAVLEFETTVQGTYVNGIDMITCDDDGRIVEFKVMIRPLKAIHLLHEQMRAMLERLAPGPDATS